MVCKYVRRYFFFFFFTLTFGYFLALGFSFELSSNTYQCIVIAVGLLAGSKVAQNFVGNLEFIGSSPP